MTFLNPLYLLGLGAAAIPIVIHLLTRKRPRRIEFSSVEFLREVNVAQLRRFRLRELLLLALRVLAIALLALALSRPALQGALGKGGAGAASSVVLLIDRSASMGAVESRTALSERALEKARVVLDALEPGDEVQIVGFDAAPEALFPNATSDHARARAAVEALAPRPFPTDIEAALARGLDLLARRPQINKELFLISDLQIAGLVGAARDSSVRGTLPTGLRFYIVPVGESARPDNLALTGARLRGASTGLSSDAGDLLPSRPAGTWFAAAGGGAAEVTVKSFGAASGDVAAGVRAGAREIGRAFVTLGAGEGSALVPLSEAPTGGGEAFLPDDALDADNHRWFASGPGGRTQVGLIEGVAQAGSPLSIALAAGQDAGQVSFRRLEGSSLTSGALSGLDAVLLSDVPELPGGALSALVDYAKGGGSVAVVLGQRARAEFYGGKLFPALGGLGLGAARDAGGGQWTLRLAAQGHPAFEGFAARAGEPLSQAAFHRAWTLTPGPATRVLARFATDLPALVEDGRLMVFASDADGQWNDFPSRGAFLPLWLQALRSLARGSASEDLEPGDRFAQPVPVGERAPDLRMTDPRGRPVELTQSIAEGARRLVSAPLTEVGLYRVVAGGRPVREVAVNLDPRESDLARLTAEGARKRWAAYRPVVLEGGVDLARRIREGRYGREIGWTLLALALACLVAETMIARLMTPASTIGPGGRA
ncbi:MAG: BatA and WFA domain-containing protein [Candidatus Eisenbacteria bacterium]